MYALLPGKSEVNYRDMWTSLIASCSTRNLQLQLSVIHIEFEKTMHTVLQEIFPAAVIKCCSFHLGQAVLITRYDYSMSNLSK